MKKPPRHCICTLEFPCGHPVAVLGEHDYVPGVPPEAKDEALSIMWDRRIIYANLIARDAVTGEKVKGWWLTSPIDIPLIEKPAVPEPGRPNVDSVTMSSNIRFALWTHAQIFYMDDLRDWTREEVRNIKGLGPKFFGELEEVLAGLGISFKDD